jgi:hypothetical protein
VADIDQELAIAVLTSEMRENQLSPGNYLFQINKCISMLLLHGQTQFPIPEHVFHRVVIGTEGWTVLE